MGLRLKDSVIDEEILNLSVATNENYNTSKPRKKELAEVEA